MSLETPFDPCIAGQRVRLIDNPGRIGYTTGEARESGTRRLAKVEFGPSERVFKPVNQLELAPAEESVFDLIAQGKYGGARDLRRVLTLEKVKGDLTNVFYSMEATRADFHPNQFKPVLRFIESPVDRLLLADEVGLGKTVEAMYIWKELQARTGARRLLVVCPAMLREKWRRDIENLFNIAADIESSADSLYRKLYSTVHRDPNLAFASVAGLETLRPPREFDDLENDTARARLARLIDENPITDEFALFDLVIIDEAHSMRNAGTLSNQLGRLMRDSARHLLLLTATPIQIKDDNLFQLLRLIDEDRFEDDFICRDLIAANRPIVRLMRCLWQTNPDIDTIRHELFSAMQSEYFRRDPVLLRVSARLAGETHLTPETQVELARLLESRSLLDQYMTRTRKREALTRQVIRTPRVLDVRFSDVERRVYDNLTRQIRAALSSEGPGWQFPLITKQRQMASSLPAAVRSWQESGDWSELAWEDGGRLFEIEDFPREEGEGLVSLPMVDLAELERNDQKYARLLEFLRSQAGEKTVVFAFFRKTLEYLHRRLSDDGILSALLMGGMPDANEVIERFSRSEGASVLLSSEVGSEGLDLQFCRCLVNYDLPWNPMKVEQRIGRIDRLGQQAERISIVNLVVQDTIEDRILSRLYDRIDLFKESIGDLEAILGERTDQLLFELINPVLTEQERERLLAQIELAITNQREEQARLEREAANLHGLAGYINQRIKEIRDQRRWLDGAELYSYVTDFFAAQFPGTSIVEESSGKVTIQLSDEARQSLTDFITRTSPSIRTVLNSTFRPIPVAFDPTASARGRDGTEVISVAHPLIQWIQERNQAASRPLHPVSATAIPEGQAGVAPGVYMYVVHSWRFSGIRQERVLVHRAIRAETGRVLDAALSERLVQDAARFGLEIPNAALTVADSERACDLAAECDAQLTEEYLRRAEDFKADNAARCNQQEASVRAFAARRTNDLRGRIEKLIAGNKTRPLRAMEGQLKKAEDLLALRLQAIERQRNTEDDLVVVAAGWIQVMAHAEKGVDT